MGGSEKVGGIEEFFCDRKGKSREEGDLRALRSLCGISL